MQPQRYNNFWNIQPLMDKISYFHRRLLEWYEVNHRVLPWRETLDPYRIWVSEIILQQTRVAQGYDYYLRFIGRFPDVVSLAEAPEDEVLLLWQGLGYYSRARNLHKAAQQIMERHEGVFPTDYESVRMLQGIGDYTAAAICSFAYNQAYAVLDGNVYRVLSRLFDEETPMDTTQGKRVFKRLAEQILNRTEPAAHNQAMMEFGALYCTPTTPDCARCPLQIHCAAYSHNTVPFLPVRKPIAPLKNRYLNYIVYRSVKDETLIHRREGQDIWKHLYEFPLWESDRLFAKADLAEYLPVGTRLEREINLTHILSHQRLHTRFFFVVCDELPSVELLPADDFLRISWENLADYALSRLTLRALERI